MNTIHMGGNKERRTKNGERRSAQSATRLFRRALPWFAFLLFTFYFLLPEQAVAEVNAGLEPFARVTTLAQDDIRIIIARIIRTGLGLLGVIAVLIVLYGGFLWMTAEGESDKMEDAKRVLTNGVIGLTIILASFAIAQFVLSRLLAATGPGSTGGPRVPAVQFPGNLTGALGAGPIVSHYPERDAADIPPNTRIFITFREPLDASSLIADTNNNNTRGTSGVNTTDPETSFDNNFDLALPTAIQVAKAGANVDWDKITPTAKDSNGDAHDAYCDEVAKLVPVAATLTADGKTVALTPVATSGECDAKTVTANTTSGSAQRQNLEGSPRDPVAYIVRIAPVIETASVMANNQHEPLFTGAWRDGYAWAFTVSAEEDTTPPKIDSVIPMPDSTQDEIEIIHGVKDQPRNVLVQVNFNEAMDPTVTSGVHRLSPASTFNFLGVQGTWTDATTTPATPHTDERVTGEWSIGNGYRTTEFQTFEACGINSCGGVVYCLPANAELLAFAEAARLEDPAATDTHYGIPFDGVMDAAGNSLDGNKNDSANGPGTVGTTPRFDLGKDDGENAGSSDSAEWQFFTTNEVDLIPPTIDEIVHYERGETPTKRVYDNTNVTDEATTNTTLKRSNAAAEMDAESVSLEQPIETRFSKPMSVTTTRAFALEDVTPGVLCNPSDTKSTGCLWYSTRLQHEPEASPAKSRAVVTHQTLRPSSDGDTPEYRVRVSSEARDVYQNCFYEPVGVKGGEKCVVTGTSSSEACEEL